MHTSILLQYINRTDGPVKDGMVQAPRQVESQANPAASRPRLLAVRQVIAGVAGAPHLHLHLLASLVRVDPSRRQAAPPVIAGEAVDGIVVDGADLLRLLPAESLVRVDQDLLASLVRVDPIPHQAAHQEIAGDLHPVGDIRHLVVASLVNQVVASQARADPRAHHPAVETGATAAGDHTEVGAGHLAPVASLVNQDPRVHRAVEIGDTVEVGVIAEDGAHLHRRARVERAMEEYRATLLV